MHTHSAWSLAGCEGRAGRELLIRFWLAAPYDLIENLWKGEAGIETKRLIVGLRDDRDLDSNLVELRDDLNQILRNNLTSKMNLGVLIANFLVSPVGKFKISNASAWMPSWLLCDYISIYESNDTNGRIAESSERDVISVPKDVPKPDFGKFPETLEELVTNRIQLNRMLGLSNLYFIDPEDKEIMEELMTLRKQLCGLIFNCDEARLERFWAQDLGDRYWAFVRSGIQSEGLDEEDLDLKDKSTRILSPANGGGFGTPKSTNAFLVSMLYYLPGTMKVEGASSKVPSWLLAGYQEIFEKGLAS